MPGERDPGVAVGSPRGAAWRIGVRRPAQRTRRPRRSASSHRVGGGWGHFAVAVSYALPHLRGQLLPSDRYIIVCWQNHYGLFDHYEYTELILSFGEEARQKPIDKCRRMHRQLPEELPSPRAPLRRVGCERLLRVRPPLDDMRLYDIVLWMAGCEFLKPSRPPMPRRS